MFARFMFEKKNIKRVFKKKEIINFQNKKLNPWNTGYWLIQPFFVGFPYKFYYNKFQINGWENVPANKPIIFAISHRNAFMDALAFVNTHSTQIWQLARGDAWSSKPIGSLLYFFHMLPLWRERDSVDTKEMNEPTFLACADLLSHNAMIGIYPEGNCVNEEHIRPLKKGICRIAFIAEERYNYELDVHIIPVGVNYTGAEKFKKWQLINFGVPIKLTDFSGIHQQNPALAFKLLKDSIEYGMKKVALHVEHSPFHHDIVALAQFYGRNDILQQNIKYEPISKFDAEQKIVSRIEKYKDDSPDGMESLVNEFREYQKELKTHNFRENTFDKTKQYPLTIFLMGIYFLLFLPVFIYGFLINYIPYKIPQLYVEKKFKQKIFWSSAKYVTSLFLFPIYYLILFIIIYKILDSGLSALIFLISFPIAGNIAFYYWFDLKKWFSVLRFKNMRSGDRESLVARREKILKQLSIL